MYTSAQFMAALTMLLLLGLLSGCSASTPDTAEWYPGANNPTLTASERMNLIDMENANWMAERQREQEIWNRLQAPSYYHP